MYFLLRRAGHLCLNGVLGVFIANMLSWGAQRGIDYLIAKEIVRIATEELARTNTENRARLEKQRKLNAIEVEERKLEKQEREAGLRQSIETCNFWKKEYIKSPSSLSKMHRDQACQLVNQFR